MLVKNLNTYHVLNQPTCHHLLRQGDTTATAVQGTLLEFLKIPCQHGKIVGTRPVQQESFSAIAMFITILPPISETRFLGLLCGKRAETVETF